MKKILFLAVLITMSLPLAAQHKPDCHPHHQGPKEVTEIVSDLTPVQKRKIESITKESRTRVDALRTQQHAVRDSINNYMEKEGDQSKKLFPLFDREAKLQVAVSREMYNMKVKVDDVLTKEQRAELRRSLAAQRPPKEKHRR